MLHSKDKVSCAKHSLGREAPLAPRMPSKTYKESCMYWILKSKKLKHLQDFEHVGLIRPVIEMRCVFNSFHDHSKVQKFTLF